VYFTVARTTEKGRKRASSCRERRCWISSDCSSSGPIFIRCRCWCGKSDCDSKYDV